jgi:hypothetical protein
MKVQGEKRSNAAVDITRKTNQSLLILMTTPETMQSKKRRGDAFTARHEGSGKYKEEMERRQRKCSLEKKDKKLSQVGNP